MTTYTLVLLRHGESTWNKENKFTGNYLKEKNFRFDVVYTSVLKRAICTTWNVLKTADLLHVPVIKTWRLNERHYGSLQGLNKSETAKKYGEEQVKIWRRSYDIPPPKLDKEDSRWPGHNVVYKNIPKDALPFTECLKDTVERVLPFWFDHIAPDILANKKVLVSAHGNSLRGLVKHLDSLTEADVLELNIPTGVPLVYELDENLKPIKHYYLLDSEELKKKMDEVANQGKAK
ncbi:phosphoglycerate mutase, putative [Plasmodium ovale]|uniref:Phosphoglycerate mutase n=1 Tax=Plasmodium ovale TaxID=36330 RepID=A0A1C3KSG0_PLAOA|nr:phosphoglycerate mutase, putative [Plasmodium ovale]